jgi:hypothetical protein
MVGGRAHETGGLRAGLRPQGPGPALSSSRLLPAFLGRGRRTPVGRGAFPASKEKNRDWRCVQRHDQSGYGRIARQNPMQTPHQGIRLNRSVIISMTAVILSGLTGCAAAPPVKAVDHREFTLLAAGDICECASPTTTAVNLESLQCSGASLSVTFATLLTTTHSRGRRARTAHCALAIIEGGAIRNFS